MKRIVAVLLVGCGGGGDDGSDTAVETECGGAGAPVLEVGDGGLSGFAPWADGDPVTIVADGGGRYGYYADLLTRGIDTTSDVTALVRFTVGASTDTQDVAATLTLQCPNEGPGWFGLFVPLDDTYQDPSAVAELEGAPMHLTASVVDASDETGTAELDLVVTTE